MMFKNTKALFCLFLLFVFFLAGCTQNYVGGSFNPFPRGNGFPSSGNDAGLERDLINVKGPDRGIVIDFPDGKPPGEIFGNFVVGLNMANYMGYDVMTQLSIWDTSPLDGFNDQADMMFSFEPSNDEEGYYMPYKEVYDLGIFNYENIRVGDSTAFFAEIEYPVQSVSESNFCLTHPDYEKDISCSVTESISGESKLGLAYSRDPVYVSKIKKEIYGAGEGSVFLNLIIEINDAGKGEILSEGANSRFDEGKVIFNLISLDGSISFNCRSDNSVKNTLPGDSREIGLPMELNIARNSKAVVSCNGQTDVFSPLEDMRIRTSLDYQYKYKTSTGEISING